MKSSRQNAMDQARITSGLDREQCLDAMQLKTLEQSYRAWVHASTRSDVRLSRKRILLLFLLIRYTGARLNEIMSLHPLQDIDFGQHLVRLCSKQTKSGMRSRKVPIPQSLSHEIQSEMSDPTFSALIKDGLAVDPGFVRRKFYERSASCGFDKNLGGPEMIRKARALELLMSNMPLPAVQRLLGHSTPNLTDAMACFSEEEILQLTRLFIAQESERKTSARNSFFCKITAIEQGDILSRIEMVTLDGFAVTATITHHSLIQLGLKQGRLVTTEVKAPWVILQKRADEAPSCTAENQFKGIVTRVNEGQINTEYVVRISDVTEVCGIVTTESFRQLHLEKGDGVWVLFNSSAVVLHA